MSVDIRLYKAEDFDQVWALHEKTIKENPGGFVKNLSFHTDMQDIDKAYDSFFVLAEKEKIKGMIGLRKAEGDSIEIKRLQVDSDYQGLGYSKMLLERVVEYCQEQKVAQIVLDVSEPQKKARKLYEAYGFSVSHQKERFLGPDKERFMSTYMRKIL